MTLLCVGDDWAEEHHDVEFQDQNGRRLRAARLPEGVVGLARFHELVAALIGEDADPAQVRIGIETDRGPWVTGLVAAGYTVYAVNPKQVSRYRERHHHSGAKSDAGDAHALADMVRLDAHQLRSVAGDSALAEAIKVVSRAHQNLVWDRHRQLLRLRSALREYFPAALDALDELASPHALRLLALAPEPQRARRLPRSRIAQVLRSTGRRNIEEKATLIQQALRSEQLAQPAGLVAGYVVMVEASVAVIQALNSQITTMEAQLRIQFAQHPDAKIYRSQPGIGDKLGARVLGEFGDDPHRYLDARARKNYAGSSPVTRASGKKKSVSARRVCNRRLLDAVHQQAFSATNGSPGACAYYDSLRARGVAHHAALRQLSNRLVGILHGCLKTRTCYDESTAWGHRTPQSPPAVA